MKIKDQNCLCHAAGTLKISQSHTIRSKQKKNAKRIFVRWQQYIGDNVNFSLLLQGVV